MLAAWPASSAEIDSYQVQLELRKALRIGLPSPPALDGNVERLAIRAPVNASRPDLIELSKCNHQVVWRRSQTLKHMLDKRLLDLAQGQSSNGAAGAARQCFRFNWCKHLAVQSRGALGATKLIRALLKPTQHDAPYNAI